MKELIDTYLVTRTQELLVYRDHLNKKSKEYNDKVGSMKEGGMNVEDIGKKLEEENFELIVLLDDLKKVAMEVEILIELYRKTKTEIPQEYKEIVAKIPDYKENKRIDLFTFVVDGGQVIEREKGLLKTKLDLTKRSEAYQYFKKQK